MAEARAERTDGDRRERIEMLKARRDAHWTQKYGPDFRRMANEFPFPRGGQGHGQARDGRAAEASLTVEADSMSVSDVLKAQAAVRARAAAGR